MSGPDAVFEYVAPTSGLLTVTVNKPAGTRWVAVASDYGCGNVVPPLTCFSDHSNTAMSGSFELRAGIDTFFTLPRPTKERFRVCAADDHLHHRLAR